MRILFQTSLHLSGGALLAALLACGGSDDSADVDAAGKGGAGATQRADASSQGDGGNVLGGGGNVSGGGGQSGGSSSGGGGMGAGGKAPGDSGVAGSGAAGSGAGGPEGGSGGPVHVEAEGIVYPDDAVVNVKKAPYNAKGDGVADDSDAVQRLIHDVTGAWKIGYFPKGTYRITKQLHVTDKQAGGDQAYGFTHLQGEGTKATVFKLDDRADGFGDSASPKAVLEFGPHGSADWFDNSVNNLTIDTGTGNDGAIGLQFFSTNIGCVRDVAIRSGDGGGMIGLDLGYNDMNGPLFVKYLQVTGFRYGVKLANVVNSTTFEHIRVENQSDTGFYNGGQAVSMRDFASKNTVPALYNGGVMALIEATLEGGSGSNSAIKNEAHLFARDVKSSGYEEAIHEKVGTSAQGPNVDEHVSSAPLHLLSDKTSSLRLPIRETPEVPWDDPKDWVSVVSKGADSSGGKDSADAIQAAIDSGATTVYLPANAYHIGKTIVLRNKVRRLIGLTAWIDYNGEVKPDIRVEDGESPVVVIEGLAPGSTIEHASSRTLVIRDGGMKGYTNTGKGDLFVENVSSAPWAFDHQNVWARQINPENEGTKIENRGGTVWILGLKTERGGTLIHTLQGGKTESLGGLSYTTTEVVNSPMFQSDDSQMTVSIGEVTFGPPPFDPLVTETKGGQTKTLKRADGVPTWIGGSALPLYVGN